MNDSIQEMLNSSSLVYYIDNEETKRLLKKLVRYVKPEYTNNKNYINKEDKEKLIKYLSNNIKFSDSIDFKRIKYGVLSPDLRLKKKISNSEILDEKIVICKINENDIKEYEIDNLDNYINRFITDTNDKIDIFIEELVGSIDTSSLFNVGYFIKEFNNKYMDIISSLIEKFIDSIVVFSFKYQVRYIESISFSRLPVREISKLTFYNYKKMMERDIGFLKVKIDEENLKINREKEQLKLLEEKIKKLNERDPSFESISLEIKKLENNIENNENFYKELTDNLKVLEDDYNTPDITIYNITGMFSNCNKLKHVNLSSFDTSDIRIMKNLFFNCKSLEEVDLSSSDFCMVEDMSYMFAFCSSLKTLKFPVYFENDKYIKTEGMFSGIKQIKNFECYNNYYKDWNVTERGASYFSIFPWNMNKRRGE